MKVSVIIPTKDRPEGLKRAVESALAALPLEDATVVVVDDGCAVPASVVLAAFNQSRLKVVINHGRHGPSAARNFGVQRSDAELVFFLDDDDQLLPHYCRSILQTLPTLPPNCQFGHCASSYHRTDADPRYYGLKIATGVYGHDVPLHLRLAGLGMGFWIMRTAFDSVGGIDENLRVNEDTDFSLRLAKTGYSAYYTTVAGVLIFEDPVRSATDQSSITKSAKPIERAHGFEYLLTTHADFLLDHGDYRRNLLIRSIKYRSRARDVRGWIAACRRHRPRWEAAMFAVFGTVWLYLSIILRRLRKPPTAADRAAS